MSNLHLHHLENSRSFRILWLLEELGVDYQLTKYERTQAFLAPESLASIHPVGKAPILEVKNLELKGLNAQNTEREESVTTPLIESGHIIDYLMAKYDKNNVLHPIINADNAEWRDYDFWMHYAEASAMPPLVMRLVFTKIVERSPMLVKPIVNRVRKQVEASMITKSVNGVLNMVEKQLTQYHWFAGSQFTAADIQMGFVIEAANAGHSLNRVKYTNTLNWLKRCQARPAYQAAVEKGGKLEF